MFDAILDGELGLCVSTLLLQEYEAVIARKTKPEIAENILRAFLLWPDVRRVRVSYRWHLIEEDPDDNVFVDTALAGGAHATVTHDTHFEALSARDFLTVRVWTVEELRRTLQS